MTDWLQKEIGSTASDIRFRLGMWASWSAYDVILTYMQLSKKTIEKPQLKEIVINVIPKNLSFKGIFAN